MDDQPKVILQIGRSSTDVSIRTASDGLLNMEMISAGVRAFKAWNPATMEAEGMVCEVFIAMLRECSRLKRT